MTSTLLTAEERLKGSQPDHILDHMYRSRAFKIMIMTPYLAVLGLSSFFFAMVLGGSNGTEIAIDLWEILEIGLGPTVLGVPFVMGLCWLCSLKLS